MLYTSLADYRANPAAAQPYAVLSLYPDMLDDKGLGLVRMDFGAHLSEEEAQGLAHLTRSFYLGKEGYEQHVEAFNHHQQQFDYDKFIDRAEAETLRLPLPPARTRLKDEQVEEDVSEHQRRSSSS